MDRRILWLWLSGRSKLNGRKIKSLLEHFKSIEAVYDAESYRDIENIGRDESRSLLDKDLKAAEELFERTTDKGIFILTYDMDEYPDKLRNISPIPYILYCKGTLMDFDSILSVAVVGTRRYSDYGKLATNRIASELAKNGVIIVSGMARGLDSVAARAALRAGTPTAAVLGSGLDIVYPRENEGLMNEIAANGIVISEYPIGSPPIAAHFPERNRIIAGLSNGVLVSQAPNKSGALITARIAMENGRDVFAIPGNIFDDSYAGSNRLIQQGAKLVTCGEDIISEYPYVFRQLADMPSRLIAAEPKRAEETVVRTAKPSSDELGLEDETERDIAEILIERNANIEDLVQSLKIDVRELNIKITMLEMRGVIEKLPGNIYKLKMSGQ